MKTKQQIKAEIIPLAYILVWVLIVTAAGHLLELPATWTFCVALPMFFLMEGEPKEKLKMVFGGGTVGMLVTFAMCMAITALVPVMGSFWGWFVPVAITITLLLLLMPFAHYCFNNVGFAYMIICTVNATYFCENIVYMLGSFLIGSAINIGGALLIIMWLTNRAKKKAAQH